MGAITFSINPKLIAALKSQLDFEVFVETGTFKGETIQTVKNDFKQVYSIELSPHYYQEAVNQFAADDHVTLINDNSSQALQALMPNLKDKSVLYWLDAHWCVAEETAGALSQCPLIDELNAIHHLNADSLVIIDDARLFLTTPQAPHEVSNWPTFHAIIQTLLQLSHTHRLTVLNDCILFFPESLTDTIQQFAHQYGVDWLDLVNRCRDSEEMLIKLSRENERLHQVVHQLNNQGVKGVVRRTAGRFKRYFMRAR
jgi:hypothetical protein